MTAALRILRALALLALAVGALIVAAHEFGLVR